MGRPPCCDKEGMKKGPWTPEEDIILVSYVQDHGPGNWRTVPPNTGLMRCSKSCRLRWTNYLRPGIRRGNFSDQEEKLIFHLQALLGNRWAAIASYLPERTDNDIKNHWNTHLKKRLLRCAAPSSSSLHTEQQQHHHRSPSTTKGQWEKRLQTDINLARRALREALSVDGACAAAGTTSPVSSESAAPYALSARNISRLLDGWAAPEKACAGTGGYSPATAPTAAESASGSSSELTECSASSASNCAASVLWPPPLLRCESKATDAGEDLPLSAIESWLLLDDSSEQLAAAAQEGLLLDATLRHYGI